MAPSLLITLREGLEAALIISVILACLARLGARNQFRSVWLGTGLAVAVSLAAGTVIVGTFGELSGRAEEIFEGTAMLLAVGVLSYMVMWMRKQARNIKAHLERQVKTALEMSSALALVSLAFIVVVRKGIETTIPASEVKNIIVPESSVTLSFRTNATAPPANKPLRIPHI